MAFRTDSYVADTQVKCLGTVFKPDNINIFITLLWTTQANGNTGFILFRSDFNNRNFDVNFKYIHSDGTALLTFAADHLSAFFPSKDINTYLFAGTYLSGGTGRLGVVFKVGEADGQCRQITENSWVSNRNLKASTAVPSMDTNIMFFLFPY